MLAVIEGDEAMMLKAQLGDAALIRVILIEGEAAVGIGAVRGIVRGENGVLSRRYVPPDYIAACGVGLGGGQRQDPRFPPPLPLLLLLQLSLFPQPQPGKPPRLPG